MKFLSAVRSKYHPLYVLRKRAGFRALQSAIDPDVWIRVPGDGGMYVKLLRDLSLILPHDGNEELTRSRFDQLLREQKPDVFLDIGANVGTYSWQARWHGVPMVLLFEPDRENCRLLARTIKRNHFSDVFLIPCAVSAEVGVSNFLVDNASGATGSLVNHAANANSLHSAYGMKTMVPCPTLCLDIYADFCRDKKVFLKIDVEGAEPMVFEGGQRFFRAVMPWVIVECFDKSKLNWFADLGYQLQALDENGNFLLTPPSGVRHVA